MPISPIGGRPFSPKAIGSSDGIAIPSLAFRSNGHGQGLRIDRGFTEMHLVSGLKQSRWYRARPGTAQSGPVREFTLTEVVKIRLREILDTHSSMSK